MHKALAILVIILMAGCSSGGCNECSTSSVKASPPDPGPYKRDFEKMLKGERPASYQMRLHAYQKREHCLVFGEITAFEKFQKNLPYGLDSTDEGKKLLIEVGNHFDNLRKRALEFSYRRMKQGQALDCDDEDGFDNDETEWVKKVEEICESYSKLENACDIWLLRRAYLKALRPDVNDLMASFHKHRIDERTEEKLAAFVKKWEFTREELGIPPEVWQHFSFSKSK